MINKIKKSFERKKRRSYAKKTILNSTISNLDVSNIHVYNTTNIGDIYSAPHNYFEKLKGSQLDIFDYYNDNMSKRKNYPKQISQNKIIIGGGGLLNRNSFDFSMQLFERISALGKKSVLWGVGHNSKNIKDFGKISNYSVDISKFGLAGTRDYSMHGEYVPCVSCMNTLFDVQYEENNELGIIFHEHTFKIPEIVDQFKDFPSTSNASDLEKLINFIGNKESIITDSYHAMYWSMLLGKKVAVVPNSSKFYDFKYKPVFTNFEDCLEDIKKAQAYTGILEESRAINNIFYEKVGNYLNL